MGNESNTILSWGKINFDLWIAEKGIPISGASKSNLALVPKGELRAWSCDVVELV